MLNMQIAYYQNGDAEMIMVITYKHDDYIQWYNDYIQWWWWLHTRQAITSAQYDLTLTTSSLPR